MMKRRAEIASSPKDAAPPWTDDLAAKIVARALPETWPTDFADGFEAIWRRTLRRAVPRAWPASYRKRLLGNISIELIERLSAEEVHAPLHAAVRAKVLEELSAGRPKRQIERLVRAFADERVEVALSPILECAVYEATARIQGEIVGTRDEARRIGSLRPQALHRFAAGYNWDDGYVQLFEAIRSRHCALGTAAMLYWRGRPHFFRQYEKRSEVPSYCIDNYDLLIEIEKRVQKNGFKHHGISYDPRKDGADLTRTNYPGVGKKHELPEAMYIATTPRGAVRFSPVKKVIVKRGSLPRASGAVQRASE